MMGISTPFILRPVATILLACGLMLAGIVAYRFLGVASLPSVDIPTIVVFAARPGADPETMATSIAAPLERRLGEIAGISEITSISSTGTVSIIVQFDVDRPIDAAAHDVQAAINAAATDLPSDLPNPPYFRKFNPADAPVMTIALTSDTLSTAGLYDAADSILGQRLSQIDGVGQVTINGAEKPAVRVQLDPGRLAATGLAAQDVFNTIRSANVLEPTGGFSGPDRAESIGVNGQMSQAREYAPLILQYHNGTVLRISDVAHVIDSVANTRLAAWDGKQPAILLTITKEAGANVIDTVDRIQAAMPQLLSWLPQGIHLTVISDRTGTIRASVSDVQTTMGISIALVLMVMFLFLRRTVATLAAAVTVPLSIAGTLAGMWLLGYTLDNFSLIALTVSVGFVVDDAIVMIENIVRHRDMGKPALQAAIEGARQIGFTVVSISLSLVAVFIPLIFMGGILGRLFHEFSITLTLAIFTSAVVSLTLTPMICAHFTSTGPRVLRAPWRQMDAAIERMLENLRHFYARTLDVALRWRRTMLLLMVATIGATVWLYTVVPKGFMPIQDTGLIMGSTLAAPEVSFKAMSDLQRRVVDVILTDPAVASVGSTIGVSSGFSTLNRGNLTIQLKPLGQRSLSSEQIIARLRPRLARIVGVQTVMGSAQDLRAGGRQGGAQFQFVLLDQDLAELRTWTSRLEDRLKTISGLSDVTSDQDRAGPQQNVVIDRDAAARLGVSIAAIDNALNNAFSQRQISTIYTERNQYRVVLEVDPTRQADPTALDHIYVGSTVDNQVPLSAVAHYERGFAPLAVRHQGQFPAATISFNLNSGVARKPRRRCACRRACISNSPAMRRSCNNPWRRNRC